MSMGSIRTEISRRLVGSPREFHFFSFLYFSFFYTRHHKTVVLLYDLLLHLTLSLVFGRLFCINRAHLSPFFLYTF
jgi:hypothetical protein